MPALVPPPGTKEAEDQWIAYENLLEDGADGQDTELPLSEPSKVLAVEELCKDLKIPPPDRFKEKVIALIAKGEIVAVDKSTRTPPLEVPIRADWFGGEAETVGTISRKLSYRIRIFDEKQSKELEARRNGLSDLIQRLTFPLADGMRWIPKKAQAVLEDERGRLEKEARNLIITLVGKAPSDFAALKRKEIEKDAEEMYAKARPDAGGLPKSTLNLILREFDRRLAMATDGDLLPRITYTTIQFSSRADSEHVSQWVQVRLLLSASAEYFRKAITSGTHLKGLEIQERELLAAMDVCGDWILHQPRNSGTERTAKAELLKIHEIEKSDEDDRTKCERLLSLIEHKPTEK